MFIEFRMFEVWSTCCENVQQWVSQFKVWHFSDEFSLDRHALGDCAFSMQLPLYRYVNFHAVFPRFHWNVCINRAVFVREQRVGSNNRRRPLVLNTLFLQVLPFYELAALFIALFSVFWLLFYFHIFIFVQKHPFSSLRMFLIVWPKR